MGTMNAQGDGVDRCQERVPSVCLVCIDTSELNDSASSVCGSTQPPMRRSGSQPTVGSGWLVLVR